ncbi:MAG: translation initiation factor [Bacteroidales bacterium]|nr:translation initiation factor [Bacteroidales bacterium]
MKKNTFNDFSELFNILSEEEKNYLIEKKREEAHRLTLDQFVIREEKRSNGKFVTIIEGFSCSDHLIEEFAHQIKQYLAVGGTTKNGHLILQGKIADKVIDYLTNLGYNARKK